MIKKHVEDQMKKKQELSNKLFMFKKDAKLSVFTQTMTLFKD